MGNDIHDTGTPALTSREMKEEDISQVTEFLHQGIQLAHQAKADHEAAVKAAASTDGAPSKPTTKVWAMLLYGVNLF